MGRPAGLGNAQPSRSLHLPLASRGLALVEVRRIYRPDNTRSFTLYRIAPLRAEVTP